MNKKTLEIVLATLLILLQFGIVYGEITELPEGWTTDTRNGSVTVEDGVIRMICDTSHSPATGRADVTTSSFSLEGKNGVLISYTMKLSGFDSNSLRTLALYDNFGSIELLRIRDKKITLLAVEELSEEVIGNENIQIEFALDLVNRKAVVRMKGEKVFDGASTELNKNLNVSNLNLRFRNYRLLNGILLAVWDIWDYDIIGVDSYSFSANVENDEFKTVGSINEIEIDFGTQMSEVTYQKSNYAVSRNDIPIDFEVERVQNNLLIIPKNGFYTAGNYEVVIFDIYDMFENQKHQNKIINFTLIDEDYEQPEISINDDEIRRNMREGENLSVIAIAQATGLERLDIVINSQIVKTTTQNSVEYSFTPDVGTYEIYAIVYDALGMWAATETITVNVETNDKPVIEISGVTNGFKYDINSLEGAHISATDQDGISRMDVYFNNMIVASSNEPNYYLDLSQVTYGDHVVRVEAYDIFNAKSEKILRFSVTGSITSVLYTEDFETFTSEGMMMPSGIRGFSQRGYVKPLVIDDSNNVSAAVGIETVNDGFTSGNRAFLQMPVIASKTVSTVKFDFYVDKSPSSNDTFSLQFRKTTSSAGHVFAIIYDGIIRLGGQDFQCVEKTWYTLTVVTDIPNRRFSATLYNKNTGTTNSVENISFTQDLDELDVIRIWAPNNDHIKTFIAIDNVVVKEKLAIPSINEIGYSGKTNVEKIDHNAESIEVYLSNSVIAQSVNADNVSIYGVEGKIAVSGVSYDASTLKITINLLQKLRSNTNYNVVLSENILLKSDISVGAEIHKSFITSYGDFEVISITFKDGGNMVSADIGIANTTASEKELLIIASAWKGDEFSGIKTYVQNILPMTTLYDSFDYGKMNAGETLEIYIWENDGYNQKMIANKIYRYVK